MMDVTSDAREPERSGEVSAEAVSAEATRQGEDQGQGEGEGEGEGEEDALADLYDTLPPPKKEELVSFLKNEGMVAFIQRYVQSEGLNICTLIYGLGFAMSPGQYTIFDQLRLLKAACSRVIRDRKRLAEYSTVDDAIHLIKTSKRIMVISGAGVSTSCGIPDFRSPTGLYARLKNENWPLDDPTDMFDLAFFRENPTVFYSFAKEIYPSNFTPSPCHNFVRLLEKNGQLLRNYTQNIDGLFEKAGVKKLINCHGSFATASCLKCKKKYSGIDIEPQVFACEVPLCQDCLDREAKIEAARVPQEAPKTWRPGKDDDSDEDEEPSSSWLSKPVIKPDIVFFGEGLSEEFDHAIIDDRDQVDLVIVMGTSLRVAPVSQLVHLVPHSVPQILINRDPITHANFDIYLLGDGDTIVRYLTDRLGNEYDLGGDAFPADSGAQTPCIPPSALDKARASSLEPTKPGKLEMADTSRVEVVGDTAQGSIESVGTEGLVGDTGSTLGAGMVSKVEGGSAAESAAGDVGVKGDSGALSSFPPPPGDELRSSSSVLPPTRVSTSPVWLFEGANTTSPWIEMVRGAYDAGDPDLLPEVDVSDSESESESGGDMAGERTGENAGELRGEGSAQSESGSDGNTMDIDSNQPPDEQEARAAEKEAVVSVFSMDADHGKDQGQGQSKDQEQEDEKPKALNPQLDELGATGDDAKKHAILHDDEMAVDSRASTPFKKAREN